MILLAMFLASVLLFAATRIAGVSFVADGLNTWALVVTGLSAVGGFAISWLLPYRPARIINGIFFGYIMIVLIAWAGCGSCYKTVVKREIIATEVSPDGSLTAVAYKNGAAGKLDLNVRVTVERQYLGVLKKTRHLTYEYGAGDVVLFWLDDDSLAATFGPDKIYSKRWDL